MRTVLVVMCYWVISSYQEIHPENKRREPPLEFLFVLGTGAAIVQDIKEIYK